MRSPLSTIIGFVDLLALDPRIIGQTRDYVNAVKLSSEDLLGLINDLLDMSKIDAGKFVLNPQFSELPPIIETSANLFTQRFHDKGIKFKIKVDPELSYRVFVDSLRIKQMVTNLLSNALKFTKEGEVCISTEVVSKTSDEVVVSIVVSDTGIGIAAEDIPRLFQRFEQVGNGPKFGGTGLGLAITKEFASMMGGDIQVVSRLGIGTTFRIQIALSLEPSSNIEMAMTKQKEIFRKT